MSDFHDDQDEAEVFDDDALDRVDYPPDELSGVAELLGRDVTVAGDFAPDSLAERIAREEPDTGTGSPVRADVLPGGLLDPGDPFGEDTIAELVGEQGEMDDDFGGVVLTDSAVADHGADTWPAEEAALHLIDEPGSPLPVDLLETANEPGVVHLDSSDERLNR